MSHSLTQVVWESKQGLFTSAEKHILVRLAACSEAGMANVCEISITKLAKETGYSTATVRRTMKSLLNKNLLEIVHPFTARAPGTYRVNVFRLLSTQKGGA